MDENVDPAKFRRLCSAFPHLGFGVPCWCRVVRALGKYLDPAGDRDRCGPQNPEYGGTKISGNRPRGLSAQGVTSDIGDLRAVQFKMC